MHTTLSILNARRRRRRGTMVALLAGCAGLVGCGGSAPGHQSTPAGAPAAASATAAAPKPAVASAVAASAPQASSGSAIARQCSASAGGNPATMIVCLAKHGVKVQTNGRFVSCVQSASDAAAVNACVTRDIK